MVDKAESQIRKKINTKFYTKLEVFDGSSDWSWSSPFWPKINSFCGLRMLETRKPYILQT